MQRSERVIFTLPAGLALSGVTIWTVGLARRLTRQGRAVGLIHHATIPPAFDLPLPQAADQIRCLSQTSPYDFYTTADVVSYAADYRRALPGTIILNGGAGAFAACALIATESPETGRFIGLAHADEPMFYDWLSYYEPILHKIIAVSDLVAAKLGDFIPQRRADIVVRPCAVEVDPTLDRPYASPEEPIRLMYAGRLIEQQKRVSDLIHLAQALESAGVNFRLSIVGDGPAEPRLRQALAAISPAARRRVVLPGSVPPTQMSDLWRKADVCVLVSGYEGTSVSMLEAMAEGCVPVVTEVSGVSDVIRPGANGFFTPVGDMVEMARMIQMLAQDRQRLAGVGAAAHATIVKCFGYEQYTPWFLELVDQVGRQPPRPWPPGRPLHRQPTIRERLDGLSGEQLGRLVPTRKLIKALGFQTAAQPAFRWLYRLRGLGKKLLGG